jgi:glutathione S-transferase
MRLQQLDGWLTQRRFIATEDFTVADILMTHVLDAGTPREMLKQYPNLLAYRARCTERPAWKKTLEAYNERVEAA